MAFILGPPPGGSGAWDGVTFLFSGRKTVEEGNMTVIKNETNIINSRYNKSNSSYIF